MIRTLDLVALLENLPESRLRRGDVGIVVCYGILRQRSTMSNFVRPPSER